MRYFLKKNNEAKVNVDANLAISMVRQPSLVDDFYCEKTTSCYDGEVVLGVHNPLYMLFNQQRLDRLGDGALRMWLDSMNQSQHSSLSELRKKCSDDDLLRMVKSRFIQHPAELERYISDLNTRADKFNSEVARVRAEMQAEQESIQQQQLKTE